MIGARVVCGASNVHKMPDDAGRSGSVRTRPSDTALADPLFASLHREKCEGIVIWNQLSWSAGDPPITGKRYSEQDAEKWISRVEHLLGNDPAALARFQREDPSVDVANSAARIAYRVVERLVNLRAVMRAYERTL